MAAGRYIWLQIEYCVDQSSRTFTGLHRKSDCVEATITTLSEKNYETLCFCIATELSCIYKGIQLITAKYVPQQTCQLALRTHSDVRETSGFVITTEPLGFVLTKQVNDFQLRVQPPIHCVLVGKLETPVLWHVTILSALILAKPAIITTMLGY